MYQAAPTDPPLVLDNLKDATHAPMEVVPDTDVRVVRVDEFTSRRVVGEGGKAEQTRPIEGTRENNTMMHRA